MKTMQYILLFGCFCLCIACSDEAPVSNQAFPPSQTTDPGTSAFTLDGALNGANKALNRITGSELSTRSTEEVQKLFQFEYFVEDIPLDLDAEEMQIRLQDLGKKRWDCFNMEHVAKGSIRVFCKRRPDSYLQYMKMF